MSVPQYIKYIFIANGFDDKNVLCTLDENTFIETKEFAQNDLVDLNTEDESEKHYGIFKNNKKKFKILEGFKRKLMMVSFYYKSKVECLKKNEYQKPMLLKYAHNKFSNIRNKEKRIRLNPTIDSS